MLSPTNVGPRPSILDVERTKCFAAMVTIDSRFKPAAAQPVTHYQPSLVRAPKPSLAPLHEGYDHREQVRSFFSKCILVNILVRAGCLVLQYLRIQ